jgi:hypothetical protein
VKRKYVRGSGRQATPTDRATLLVERATGAADSHDLANIGRALRTSDLPPAEHERVERAIHARAQELDR